MPIPRAQASRHLVASIQKPCPRTYSTTLVGAAAHKAYIQEGYKRAAFLRTSHFLDSPADAFTLIRAVERQYGAIREYRFVKDYEVPTKYQTMIQVSFRDPKSRERIPPTSETISVNLPTTIRDRSGGIGLDELEPLLESHDYAKDEGIPAFGSIIKSVMEEEQRKDSRTENTIDVKVERSGVEFFSPPPVYSYFSKRNGNETARNFVHWAGFNELQPMEADTPIVEGLLFQPSNVDHPQLRLVLRKYCDALNVPNPYEVQPISKSLTDRPSPEATDSRLAWTPLPGYENVPADTPMPSAVPPPKEIPLTTTPTSCASASTALINSPPSKPVIPSTKPVKGPAALESRITPRFKHSKKTKSNTGTQESQKRKNEPQSMPLESTQVPDQKLTTKEVRNDQESTMNKAEDRGANARWKKFLGGWL